MPRDCFAANQPKKKPHALANITSAGIMMSPAMQRGRIRWVIGERPRLSRASICSVTRIVPSSAAEHVGDEEGEAPGVAGGAETPAADEPSQVKPTRKWELGTRNRREGGRAARTPLLLFRTPRSAFRVIPWLHRLYLECSWLVSPSPKPLHASFLPGTRARLATCRGARRAIPTVSPCQNSCSNRHRSTGCWSSIRDS